MNVRNNIKPGTACSCGNAVPENCILGDMTGKDEAGRRDPSF